MSNTEASIRFTTSEFLLFAKSVQSREWHTLSHKKIYHYSVEKKGISITTSKGERRLASISEITKFCELFNNTNSFKTKDYSRSFYKSYLLPIARVFEQEQETFFLAEEILNTKDLQEGAVKLVSVNAYERSPEARRLCINAHGTSCAVCGFSFETVYGDIASGFIHVHHLTPLALKGGTGHKVDPVKDLRPVCPNCHAVIHIRGECLSIEELKALLSSAK